jgi:hypothetical protein
MPMGLDSHGAGEPGHTVVCSFSSRKRGSASQCLGKAKGQVISLATAQEKPNTTDPIYLASEGEGDKLFGCGFSFSPEPALVNNWIASRLTNGIDHVRMLVTEWPTRIASVDKPATVIQNKFCALAANDTDHWFVASVESGLKQPAHLFSLS